jgi:hypothetical protein
MRKTKRTLKRLFQTAMVSAPFALAVACEQPTETPQPKLVDKTLTFEAFKPENVAEPYTKILQYDADKTVGNIFLKPENTWEGIPMMVVRDAMEKAHAQSPKVKAAPNAIFLDRGPTDEFLFFRSDSLKLVKMGYRFGNSK